MDQLGVAYCDFIEDVENVKRFDLAKALCINRKKDIDNVNNELNQHIKSYVDDEDQYYREIQVKTEKLSASVSEGSKTLDFKPTTELDQKLQVIQKESKHIQQKFKETEDKREQSTQEHKKQKDKLVKLIEEIQLSVLNKLDLPEPDNKSGVIFNWIVGCLIKQKKGPIQLAEHLKLKVEKMLLPPESIINQPAPPQSGGLFACGGRKPISSRPIKRMTQPEEEQRYYENLFAWKAIKQYVFHQDFKFQEKVTQLTIEIDKLEPYQLMLIEEMVNEKKDIIRAIFDIDIKDQARVLIEISEIILFLLKQKEVEQNQDKEEKKLEEMDAEQRQLEIEVQIMVQQKTFLTGKEKRLNALKSTLNQIKTHSDKITEYVKEKMSTNDQLIQQIELMRTQGVSKELKVSTDIEDAYRRKRQEEAEKLIQEQEEKELLAQEELKRKKEEDEKRQFESNQKKEEEVFNSNNAGPEENPQDNRDDDEDEADEDESEDDVDEDGVKQDWIDLSNDPETRLIQKTLFPDKVKTAENKNLAKQKNKGESLKALMAKRKKN